MNVINVDIASYNRYMIDPNFWQQKVMGENILLFQTDSVLCGHSKLKIDDFMKYDYVGAPWVSPISCPGNIAANSRVSVGNGGLSFRKRSKLVKALKTLNLENPGNEDIIISCLGARGDLITPPFELARSFSVETVFHEAPFGVHKPWPYQGKNEMQALTKTCPEVDSILKPYYKW